MPRYDVRCVICGDQEVFATMSEAVGAKYLDCPICQRPRPRIFYPPQFTEDRLRLWRGPLGNGYSTALGEQMPATRAERDRLAAKKGVEFVTKSELLASNKEAAEAIAYKAEVDSGVPHRPIGPGDTSAFKEAPPRYKDILK
jgi:hypothetical protein